MVVLPSPTAQRSQIDDHSDVAQRSTPETQANVVHVTRIVTRYAPKALKKEFMDGNISSCTQNRALFQRSRPAASMEGSFFPVDARAEVLVCSARLSRKVD